MLKIIKRSLRRIRYKAYLKSDKWRKKRHKVLQRDNFRCIRCGSKRNLNVHHLTYKRIFNEPLTDLITLCSKCHKREHNQK